MSAYAIGNGKRSLLFVKLNYKRTGELLGKGMKIYSAIDSPKEVKALFEPLEMKYVSMIDALKLIDQKQEKIE